MGLSREFYNFFRFSSKATSLTRSFFLSFCKPTPRPLPDARPWDPQARPKSGVCSYKALSHHVLITYHPKQTRCLVLTSVLITVVLSVSFMWADSSPAQTVLLSSS